MMNRIILIGNGFDLAHGLPTRYKDFIDWYWERWFKTLRKSFKNTESDELCSFTLKGELFKWNYLIQREISILNPPKEKNVIDCIKNKPNYYIVKQTPFMEKVCRSIDTKGWVDIENEFYNILRSFAQNECPQGYDTPEKLNSELELIKSLLIEYLVEIQNNQLNNNNNIYPEIENIITEPFDAKDISIEGASKFYKESQDIKLNECKPSQIMLLNFNYTKTADINTSTTSNFIINHIHGELTHPQSIIFGYGDELDDDYKDLLKLNDNTFLKNIKSIRYLESDRYRKLLEFIEHTPYQVYIMGHSCGNSDRTLLNTLFEHKNCISIKPFYYQKTNGSDNYLEIVQNISRNFTNMKLMRDRVVNKEFCKPLPQKEQKIK